MMVEDEFYAVAQTFTQHMHYAEYIRRTKEAKVQNAARIQDIARPTDGVTPMSEDRRKRKEAEVLAERQKEGLGQLQDENGGDAEKAGVLEEDVLLQDDSLAGTSLYDLMMSPRKVRSLVGSRGIKSTTRAAAGYAQTLQQSGSSAGALPSSPLGHGAREQQYTMADETASEDDDDDLDLDVQPATTFNRTLQDIKTRKTEKSEPAKPSIAPTKYVSHEPAKTTQPETTPSISARNINPPNIPNPGRECFSMMISTDSQSLSRMTMFRYARHQPNEIHRRLRRRQGTNNLQVTQEVVSIIKPSSSRNDHVSMKSQHSCSRSPKPTSPPGYYSFVYIF